MLHINYQYLSLSITVGERGEQKLVYIKGKIDITPPCKQSSGIQLLNGTNFLWESFSVVFEIHLYIKKYVYLKKIVKAAIVPLPSQLFCGGWVFVAQSSLKTQSGSRMRASLCWTTNRWIKLTIERRLFAFEKKSEMNLLHWGLNPSTSNPAGILIQVNGITCLSKTSRI